LAASLSAQTQRLSVSIPSLKLTANERIVGFDIHVQSGVIVELPKVPFGWSLSIDNDPSWKTRVSGSLSVGAAALGPDFFRDFLVIDVEKDAPADVPFALHGEVIVTSDFATERRVKLGMKDFVLKAASSGRTGPR